MHSSDLQGISPSLRSLSFPPSLPPSRMRSPRLLPRALHSSQEHEQPERDRGLRHEADRASQRQGLRGQLGHRCGTKNAIALPLSCILSPSLLHILSLLDLPVSLLQMHAHNFTLCSPSSLLLLLSPLSSSSDAGPRAGKLGPQSTEFRPPGYMKHRLDVSGAEWSRVDE